MSDAKSPSDLSMDEILATIRRIIADDEQASAASGAAAGTAAIEEKRAAAEDVLELTRALNEDGTVRELAPIGGSRIAAREPPRDAPPAAPSPADASPDQPEASGDKPSTAPTTPTAVTAAVEERLVSEVTSLAAAAAFARVAAAPRARGEAPQIGGRPLDEIVEELLRPLLRTWLDENLPAIVERLVQAEIARIARSGGG